MIEDRAPHVWPCYPLAWPPAAPPADDAPLTAAGQLALACEKLSYYEKKVRAARAEVARMQKTSPRVPKPEIEKTETAILVSAMRAMGIVNEQYISKRRNAELVLPRHAVWYCVRYASLASLACIARRARRAHSTIIHGLQSMRNLIWAFRNHPDGLSDDERDICRRILQFLKDSEAAVSVTPKPCTHA